jgi:hypothetical protein
LVVFRASPQTVWCLGYHLNCSTDE